MTDPCSELSLDSLQTLTELVETFEQCWRRDACLVEEFLLDQLARPAPAGTPEIAWRSAVTRAVIAVDLEFRRDAGQTPTEASYQAWLPGFEHDIVEAFRSLKDPEPSDDRPGSAVEPDTRDSMLPKESGQQIGTYVIERELGRGGMGVIYLARQKGRHGPVALKAPLPGQSADALSRFRLEALAASAITSDAVVRIYDVNVDGEPPFFVMQYVAGGALIDLLASGPLKGRRAVGLLEPVARALGRLHAEGILHRDLKPSNLLYDADQDRALLSDFGLAKLAPVYRNDPCEPVDHTTAATVLGTPAYMAPEQTQQAGNVTPSSDVYGLGATLYHLVCGCPPFHSPDVPDLIRQIRESEPVPPHRLVSSVSTDLSAVCLKCLEKRPEDRYASAAELADDLLLYLEGRPVRARVSTPLFRVQRWCLRNRLATAFLLVLGLGLLTTTLMAVTMVMAYSRARQATTHADRLAQRLQHSNDDLQKMIEKASRLTTEAEAGRYDLMLDRLKFAFQQRCFGEVRTEEVPPKDQVGWEWSRLIHEARQSLPRLVAQFGEHDAAVLDAVFSTDGRSVISCGADGLIVAWDCATNRQRKILVSGRWSEERRCWLPYAEVRSPDCPWPPPDLCPVDLEAVGTGNEVVLASLDGSVVLVSIETGAQTILWRDTSALECLAAEATGKQILVGAASGQLTLLERGLSPGVSKPSAGLVAQRQLGSPVLCLKAVEAAGWIVGCEDGRVLILDPQLQPVAQTVIPGPVWSVDACRSALQPGAKWEVVVGCQSEQIRLYEISENEPPRLSLKETFNVPGMDSEVAAVHSVRFSPSSRDICGSDHQGRLFAWSRDQKRLLWATRPARQQALGRQREQFARLGWPYPYSLQRAGRVADCRLPDNESGAVPYEFLVCSTEFTVQCLAGPETTFAAGRRQLQGPEGGTIEFDPLRPGLMWGLSVRGQLTVFNLQGHEISRTDAHDGLGDLTVIPSDHPAASLGNVLTAGDDGLIRSWTYRAPRGLSTGRVQIRHRIPILRIALHPSEPAVAGVDAEGAVNLWDLRTHGAEPVRRQISGQSGRPVSGCIRFDATGAMAAAFGVGSNLSLLRMPSCEPFTIPRLDVHTAGTALLWNPLQPTQFLAADLQGRLMIRDINSSPETPPGLGFWRFPCVDLQASPDRRRIFALRQEGNIEVLDSRRYRTMLKLNAQSNSAMPVRACELAMSPFDDSLAVSFADGRVELWDGSNPVPASIELTHETIPWDSRVLHVDQSRKFSTHHRAMALNPRGEVVLLALRGDETFEELIALHESSGAADIEVIESDSLEYSTAAFALMFDSGGDAVAVYRGGQVPSEQDAFQFRFRVARRPVAASASSRWTFEPCSLVGNVGRFPAPFLTEGAIEKALFLTEDNYHLQVCRRGPHGWDHVLSLGRQGDGVGLIRSDDPRKQVFAFTSRPGMAQPSIPYAGWFEGQRWIREVIDPSADAVSAITLDELGRPLALIGRNGRPFLARRLDHESWTCEPVPGEYPGLLHCDSEGRISVVNHERTRGWLSRYVRGTVQNDRRRWSTDRILKGDQLELAVLHDAQHRPVVVTCEVIGSETIVRVHRKPLRHTP